MGGFVTEQVGHPRVAGYCPMGCGRTLFLGSSGHVTCSYLPCPNPTAVDTLLDNAETEHVVLLDANTFTVQHPLRERLAGELWECGLHARIAGLDGPPRTLGKYRVRIDAAVAWRWTRVVDTPVVASEAGPQVAEGVPVKTDEASA